MDLEASGRGLALAGPGAPWGCGFWIIWGSTASQPPRLHTACCTCRPGVLEDDRHLPTERAQSVKNSCYESEPRSPRRFELHLPRSQGRAEGTFPLQGTRSWEVMPLQKGKLLKQQTPQGHAV